MHNSNMQNPSLRAVQIYFQGTKEKDRLMHAKFRIAAPFQRRVFGSFTALGDVPFTPLSGRCNFFLKIWAFDYLLLCTFLQRNPCTLWSALIWCCLGIYGHLKLQFA